MLMVSLLLMLLLMLLLLMLLVLLLMSLMLLLMLAFFLLVVGFADADEFVVGVFDVVNVCSFLQCYTYSSYVS